MSCLTGIAGLSAEDFSTCDCRIRQVFKHCTVVSDAIRVDIGNPCGMSGRLNNLPERIILNTILHQHRNILNRTVMIRIMQSRRIAEMRIIHSKLGSFLIHQLRKIRLRSTDRIRQRNTTLRSRRQHRAIKKINHPDFLSRLKSRLRSILLIQPREHLIRQRNLLIQIIKILNSKNHRHNLRHRSRINLLIPIDLTQNLTASRLHQNRIRTIDSTDIHFLQNRLFKLLKPFLHTLIPANHNNERTDNQNLHEHTRHDSSTISPRIASPSSLFPSPNCQNRLLLSVPISSSLL